MKCPIKNHSDYDIEAHQDLIDSLFTHANEELGFKKPPALIFQSDPRNYGALSKTAQYNPSSQEITIYVDGRHMKDILRSFAHELVHHHQNEQGRLSGANVTQGEQDFDDIEGEAYHTGNLKLFRKWEDGIKQKNPTIYNERRIYKMSTKKWKNKELSNLMTEKFGFKMDLKKLNEGQSEPGGEDHFFHDKEGAANRYRNQVVSIDDIVSVIQGTTPGRETSFQEIIKQIPDTSEEDIIQIGKDNPDIFAMSPTGMQMSKEYRQGLMAQAAVFEEAEGCGDEEPMEEEKKKDCEECDKPKADCECDPDPIRRMGFPDYQSNKNENLKEHKIWNDKNFKMDLSKLLK